MNVLLLVYDSCRFDVLCAARTPVLDSYCRIWRAHSPANFTYPAHQAFFVGILPHVPEDVPYYNRFRKQLVGLAGVGEGQVSKEALQKVCSTWNLVRGLQEEGHRTVGAGAVNWFRQESLTAGFERFLFTGTDADRQISFLVDNLRGAEKFFAFINFGETHAPYTFAGKAEPCRDRVLARLMRWPPVEAGPVGAETCAFRCQVAAAEFLDSRLPALFDALPGDTVVILTADHGECFGEDGYLGHGVHHPLVYEVPLSIFRLDRRPLPE